jgi:DNA replication initiation complex subunit (GINS family)
MGNDETAKITITYETLYEFLRKEKTREEIQELPLTFYDRIVEYLEKKKQELKEHTVSLDLFADNRRRDSQAGNVVKIIREIYDRREKKILFLAMNKARTDSNIIDTTHLLPQEKELFDSIVYNLKKYRQDILFSLFSGKREVYSSSIPITANQSSGSNQTKTGSTEEKSYGTGNDYTSKKTVDASSNPSEAKEEAKGTKIQFLQKMPKFVGKSATDVYGPFEANDTVELPSDIAQLLIRKGRAQQITE